MKKRRRALLLFCLAAAGLWLTGPLSVPAAERIAAGEISVGKDNSAAETAGDSTDEGNSAAENAGDSADEERSDTKNAGNPPGENGLTEEETEEEGAALSEDIEDLTKALLDELDLDGVDDILAENEFTQDISFSDIVTGILSTDTEISARDVWNEMRPLIFADAAEYKSILVRILILTIAFAFFHNFIDVFENSQISRSGFYLFFLVLMVLLTRSYLIVSGMFEEVMSQTVAMMEAVIPAFSMTLIFASAQTTAAAFYQIAVGVIWLVEQLLTAVVAPVIHIFAVLQMLNCLTGETMISRLTALIRNLIQWSLKALLAGVTGINVIETMIAPSVDNLKKMSVTKVLGMIPGLGSVTEAVGNIFLGSALVIKNGVGVAAMIVVVGVSFVPLVKMLLFFLMFKAAGAMVQPFASTQVCNCIDGIGESAGLLLKTLLTGILMILLTIAIVITAVR